MGLAEAIEKIKEISEKLQDRNISDREVIHYNQELHRLIDNFDVKAILEHEGFNMTFEEVEE